MDRTIAAIATGSGEAGIGIIRISGPESLALSRRLFQPRRAGAWDPPASHQLVLGEIVDGELLLDQVMAVYMKGPRSFTGEDVVEIQIHGSAEALRESVVSAGAALPPICSNRPS